MTTKLVPQEVIDEICAIFKSGICIPIIKEIFKMGRNKITQILRENVSEEEYKTSLKLIRHQAGQKSAKKNRGRKNPHTLEWNKKIRQSNIEHHRLHPMTEETKEKIGQSGRTRFERGTWTREKQHEAVQKSIEKKRKNGYFKLHGQRHSAWLKEHHPFKGKHHSEETRQKMRDSKYRLYTNGYVQKRHPMSEERRRRQSEITRQAWKNGCFDYRKRSQGRTSFRSNLEIAIFDEFKKRHPDSTHSKRISTNVRSYVYDVYVPNLNLLIEINGDYWHLNPLLYDNDHFDKSRSVTTKEIWERDKVKIQAAIDAGFKIVTIWEHDVKTSSIESVVNNLLESLNS